MTLIVIQLYFDFAGSCPSVPVSMCWWAGLHPQEETCGFGVTQHPRHQLWNCKKEHSQQTQLLSKNCQFSQYPFLGNAIICSIHTFNSTLYSTTSFIVLMLQSIWTLGTLQKNQSLTFKQTTMARKHTACMQIPLDAELKLSRSVGPISRSVNIEGVGDDDSKDRLTGTLTVFRLSVGKKIDQCLHLH